MQVIMKNNNEEICRRSQCAVNIALETVGDKWSLLILRDLMSTAKRSYGELQSSEEKIATNILASRLLSLEAKGLIRKAVAPGNGRRSLYYLTEKGIDLLPVIIDLRIWAEKHYPNAEGCTQEIKLTEKNRAEVLTGFMKDLRTSHGVKATKNLRTQKS